MVKYHVEKNGGHTCWVKAFLSFTSEKKLDTGDSKVTEMRFAKERNYVPPPSKFRATRRMATCSVIEEEDTGNGMALADFRRHLVVCHTLKKVGLL